MNVLHPNKKAAIITLLTNGISQREIEWKVRVDRKTVRKYARILNKNKVTESATVELSKSPTPATGPGDICTCNRVVRRCVSCTGPRALSLRRVPSLDRSVRWTCTTKSVRPAGRTEKRPLQISEGALRFKSGGTYSPTQSPMQYHRREGA